MRRYIISVIVTTIAFLGSLFHLHEDLLGKNSLDIFKHSRLEVSVMKDNAPALQNESIGENSTEKAMLEFETVSTNTSNGFKSENVNNETASLHWPYYFSDPYHFVNRTYPRGNILTVLSGCRMASWVYLKNPMDAVRDAVLQGGFVQDNIQRKANIRDCIKAPRNKILNSHNSTHLLQDYDTIFVQHAILADFVNTTLPHVQKKIIIISNDHVGGIFYDQNITVAKLLEHDKVVMWFCVNMPTYASQFQNHPKIHPFAYGMKEFPFMRPGRVCLGCFREALRASLASESVAGATNKVGLQLAHFRRMPGRSGIANGPSLNYSSYYRHISKARYIFSPDGDRPECYRHYEALGMGAIPITQLKATSYRHLNEGPVIFDNMDWNVDYWNRGAPTNLTVNRNMAFEEFWMEYVERQVGRPLIWWDTKTQSRIRLSELAHQ